MKKLHDVPVPGGMLTVGEWGEGTGRPVLAVHGISATHMSFNTLARIGAERGLRIIAPDLRGRGRSTHLPGPYGMAAHAQDLEAVCAALDIEEATVVGHSMGAFVAMVFAHQFPHRVSGGLLVDGGLPIPPPPGAAAEDLTAAILAPIEARLAAPVPSRQAYLEAWTAHPAFDGVSDDLREYIEYDLIERDGQLWASGSLEAIRHDGMTLGTDEDLLAALTARGVTDDTSESFIPAPPMEFVRAEHGMMDGISPLYPLEEALGLGAYFGVPITTVEDVNHYTIVMGQTGAGVLGEHIGRLCHR